MESNLIEVITDIRNILQRFELVRTCFRKNRYAEFKMFEGPFGKSNHEEFEKQLNDVEKVVAVLHSKIEEVAKIALRENKYRNSKKLKSK